MTAAPAVALSEQSCLLSSCTGKTGAEGSNPSPSATSLTFPVGRGRGGRCAPEPRHRPFPGSAGT